MVAGGQEQSQRLDEVASAGAMTDRSRRLARRRSVHPGLGGAVTHAQLRKQARDGAPVQALTAAERAALGDPLFKLVLQAPAERRSTASNGA